MNSVTEAFLRARRAAGLSQRSLAKLLGVTPQFLCRVECGVKPLPRERYPLLPVPIRNAVIDAAIAELEALR